MAVLEQSIQEYDGRKTLRSLIDAVTKLRDLGGLSDIGSVQIKTLGIVLPDRRTIGLVAMLGPRGEDGSRWVIRMPSSARFIARTTNGTPQTHEIALLNDAIGDPSGNVQLADGRFLHHVDLIPAPVGYDFTTTDDTIVRHALKFLQPEDKCYLPINDELLPAVKRLDYGKLSDVRIPKLKALLNYVEVQMKGVSRSAISKALRHAGMQFPRSHAEVGA